LFFSAITWSSLFFTNAVKYCTVTEAAGTVFPFISSMAVLIITKEHTVPTAAVWLSCVPVFIVPGRTIIPFVSSLDTGCTQPRPSIISVVVVRLYQVEHKIVLLFVGDAPQRSTQRRTLAPANLNVVITRSTVVHVQIAMIIKELPIGFTRTFTRAIRQRILKVAHIALVSPRSAVLAVVGEYLTTGEEEAGVPEVVVLAQICVNAACWVFCAVVFAHFKRLNIAEDFHEVVLQDVAFTLNTTCAICWPGDTFFTWRGHVGGLREH